MRSYEPEPFRPINRRRRALIAVLAVATAIFVVWAITRDLRPARNGTPQPADVAPCARGQTVGCVGSMTSVIAAPISPEAPASAPASSPASAPASAHSR